MAELMSVSSELWCYVADDAGLWVASGTDAWRRWRIDTDWTVAGTVRDLVLHGDVADESLLILHGTSCRQYVPPKRNAPRGAVPTYMITWVAAVTVEGSARDRWPDAVPVDAGALLEVAGKPLTHAATAAPRVRRIDPMFHGLRHIAFLRDHDAEAHAQLDARWLRHLTGVRPALALIYDDRHHTAEGAA